MSLDNTSHPSVKHCADTVNARYIHGRPESELVPSRYALRVGEIDVMVVSDGVLSLPGAMLGHNVDPAVRAAWLEDMFLPPDVLERVPPGSLLRVTIVDEDAVRLDKTDSAHGGSQS